MKTLEEQKAYRQAYYQKNKDKINARSKKFAKENPEIMKTRAKKYYQKDPKKILARTKKRQQSNPEKIKEIASRSYQNNKDKHNARMKQRRINNPEKFKTIQQRYFKKHPEHLINANKKRMEKLKSTVDGRFLLRCITRWKQARKRYPHFIENRRDIKQSTFWELVAKQDCKCAITGVSLRLIDPITGTDHWIYEVDHIIPCNQEGSYHGKDNIQLVTPSANKLKGGNKIKET